MSSSNCTDHNRRNPYSDFAVLAQDLKLCTLELCLDLPHLLAFVCHFVSQLSELLLLLPEYHTHLVLVIQ